MPAVTSYSEPELAAWILGNGCLGSTAATLGWTGQSDVQDAIDLALTAYGVATIDLATDAAKLRAAVAVEAWRLVYNVTVAWYDVGLDGQTMRRSQVHEHAVKRLAMAEQLAGALGIGSGAVQMTDIDFRKNDPYAVQAVSEWG